jgi:hypothetical protein
MLVRPHPDRRLLGAAPVQERARVLQGALDQLARMADVDGDDMQRDRQLLDQVVIGVAPDQPCQPAGRHEMVTAAEEPSSPLNGSSGNTLPRRRPRQTSPSSSAVATVCGRDAMNAPLSAPADVPTITSGRMPRS